MTYFVRGFVDKNADKLLDGLHDVVLASSSPLVAELFAVHGADGAAELLGGAARRARSARASRRRRAREGDPASKFREQLRDLS